MLIQLFPFWKQLPGRKCLCNEMRHKELLEKALLIGKWTVWYEEMLLLGAMLLTVPTLQNILETNELSE